MPVDESIIVVSGLPRSGTSLMMQILRSGGVPLLTDNCRPADASNPRGYFEYEKVKWLAADNSWLGEARGKALKVIAQLVPFLPRGFRYLVLMMRRDLREVLSSQATMIQNRGLSTTTCSNSLAGIFERQFASATAFIEQQPSAAVEIVDHHDLIATPDRAVDRVIKFLSMPGLDRQAMIGTVDGGLYRSRSNGMNTV